MRYVAKTTNFDQEIYSGTSIAEARDACVRTGFESTILGFDLRSNTVPECIFVMDYSPISSSFRTVIKTYDFSEDNRFA